MSLRGYVNRYAASWAASEVNVFTHLYIVFCRLSGGFNNVYYIALNFWVRVNLFYEFLCCHDIIGCKHSFDLEILKIVNSDVGAKYSNLLFRRRVGHYELVEESVNLGF